MIITDNTFWVGLFALYLLDNIKFINRSELLIIETRKHKLVGKLSSIVFELLGKQIVFLNPITPFLSVYRMRWLNFENTNKKSLALDRKVILNLQKKTEIVRCIVLAYLMLLFVIGPLINYWISLGVAIIFILFFHLILMVLFAFSAKKNNYFSEPRLLALICLECTFCPMYAPMLLRRITWNSEMHSDGYYFVNRYCQKDQGKF